MLLLDVFNLLGVDLLVRVGLEGDTLGEVPRSDGVGVFQLIEPLIIDEDVSTGHPDFFGSFFFPGS